MSPHYTPQLLAVSFLLIFSAIGAEHEQPASEGHRKNTAPPPLMQRGRGITHDFDFNEGCFIDSSYRVIGAGAERVSVWSMPGMEKEKSIRSLPDRIIQFRPTEDRKSAYLLMMRKGDKQPHIRRWQPGHEAFSPISLHEEVEKEIGQRPIVSIAPSADGKKLAIALGPSGNVPPSHLEVMIIDTATRRKIESVSYPNTRSPAVAMAFSAKGDSLAVGTNDIYLYQGLGGGKLTMAKLATGDENSVAALTFSPDGESLASISPYGGGLVHAWNTQTKHKIFRYPPATIVINGVEMLPRDPYDRETWRPWVPSDPYDRLSEEYNNRRRASIGFSSDGKVLAWSDVSAPASHFLPWAGAVDQPHSVPLGIASDNQTMCSAIQDARTAVLASSEYAAHLKLALHDKEGKPRTLEILWENLRHTYIQPYSEPPLVLPTADALVSMAALAKQSGFIPFLKQQAGKRLTPAEVSKYIADLGSRHFPTRQAAENALSVYTGTDQLPRLKTASVSPDPEVAARAQKAFNALTARSGGSGLQRKLAMDVLKGIKSDEAKALYQELKTFAAWNQD